MEITINIPFTYTIGEEGCYTGKEFKTVQDCKDEVRAEIESGMLMEDIFMEVADEITPEQAKAALKEVGCFTDNLWGVADVTAHYNCTEEQAQEILSKALKNEAVMNSIWDAIDFAAEDLNLEML